MAKKYVTESGKEIILLNPADKGRKYCKELHDGCNVYTGEVLTDTQKSYRSGYLSARQESAKIWCKQNGVKSKAKSKVFKKKSK